MDRVYLINADDMEYIYPVSNTTIEKEACERFYITIESISVTIIVGYSSKESLDNAWKNAIMQLKDGDNVIFIKGDK